jgi:sulfate permease
VRLQTRIRGLPLDFVNYKPRPEKKFIAFSDHSRPGGGESQVQTALLIVLVSFFAMNMGASGFAPSMAAAYGAGFLSRLQALLFFSLFVLLGWVVAGGWVAETISQDIIPSRFIDIKVALIVVTSATITLFLANLLKVPQSTSQVTVGSLVGVGMSLGQLNGAPFKLMVPLWFILPLAAYTITLALGKWAYPRLRHYVLAQSIMRRYRLLQFFVIASSCYAAFSIGSNNVANATGPLVGANIVGVLTASFFVAPFFGMGAAALGAGNLETAGKELTPLGVLSATLVSFVGASLLLLASGLGMPASEVQIKLGAIFAIGVVKSGHAFMWRNPAARKAAVVWAVAPVISVAIAWILAQVFM